MSTQTTSRVSTLAAASRVVARVVARHPDLQAAYIFGSVAQGRARPDSDIDVAVLLGRHLPGAPPLLAQRVLSRGVLVFQRSRAARVRFHVATAQRYEDMVPTLERYVDRLKQHVRQGRASG